MSMKQAAFIGNSGRFSPALWFQRCLFRGFHFGPTSLRSEAGDMAALLIGHGLQPALAADLAALASHLGHDLGHQRRTHGLGFLNGFQHYAPGVLDDIELRLSRAVWHTSRMGMKDRGCQPREFSN